MSVIQAGTTRLNGKIKVRFSTDTGYGDRLTKLGHTEVDFITFPAPLSKEAAVDKLISMDYANGNAEIQAALDSAKAKFLPPEPRAPRAKKAKPTLEAIAARATPTEVAAPELEDAPY